MAGGATYDLYNDVQTLFSKAGDDHGAPEAADNRHHERQRGAKKLQQCHDADFAGEGRVIVEKSGTPVGAVVSIEDMRRLEELDREWARIEDVFRRTQAGFGGVSPEKIESEIEKAIAEVEADYDASRDDVQNRAE